jgi:hypothetical protein
MIAKSTTTVKKDIIFPSKSKYSGDILDWKLEGKGTLDFHDGKRFYDGQFV